MSRNTFFSFVKTHIKAILAIVIAAAACFGALWYAQLLAQRNMGEEPFFLTDPADWEVYLMNEAGEKQPLAYNEEWLSYYGVEYPGQTFYMTRTLTESFDGQQTAPTLAIMPRSSLVSVFLDEKLIFTNAPGSGDKIGGVVFEADKLPDNNAVMVNGQMGFGLLYVSLPADYLGKTLTIARADGVVWDGYPDAFIVDMEKTEGIAYQNTRLVLQQSYFLTALLYTGILLCVIFVIRMVRTGRGWSILLLVAYVLLSVLSQAEYLQTASGGTGLGLSTLLVNSPLPRYFFEETLNILPLFLYFLIYLKRCRIQMIALIAAYLVFSAFPNILTAIGYVPFSLKAAACAAIVLLLWWEYRGVYRVFSSVCKWAGFALCALLAFVYIFTGQNTYGSPYYYIAYEVYAAFVGVVGYLQLLLLGIAAVFIVHGMFRDSVEKSSRLALLEQKNEMATQNYRELMQHQQQVAHIHHDMKNHLLTVERLIAGGADARGYIHELVGMQQEVSAVVNTENALVNTILNSKLAQAAQQGVAADMTQVFVPPALSLSESDIVSLLTNLLDNAIDAAAKAPEGARFVELKMRVAGKYLYTTVKNGMAEQPRVLQGKMLSSKAESGHGYGLDIVRKIAKKYDGALSIATDENIFTCALSLYIG